MLASPVDQSSDSSVTSARSTESSASPGGSGGRANATDVSQAESLLVLSQLGSDASPVLLSRGRWSIGAADGNRLQVAGDNVGARHCLIVVTALRAVIKAWEPQTWLNGQPITDSEIRAGDELRVGQARFSIRAAQSGELISQLPCIPNATGSLTPSDEQRVASPQDPLAKVDELSDAIDALGQELHGCGEASDRLDQIIDRLESARPPHVSAGNCDAATELPRDNSEELDGVLDEVDRNVGSEDVAAERERLSLEIDTRHRQLESFSDSLEVRAAVLEAQGGEINARLEHLDQDRKTLDAEWTELKQRRSTLDADQQSLRDGQEELEFQRQAIQAEAADLQSLYETLLQEFPEQATRLAEEVAEPGAEAVDTFAVERSADTGFPPSLPTTDTVPDSPVAIAAMVAATPAATVPEQSGCSETRSEPQPATSSNRLRPDESRETGQQADVCAKSTGAEETTQGFVRSEPYESPWEVSQLISERIKFGQLVEELQPGPSAEDESLEEAEEVPVGVGAASLFSGQVTTNAMRSRDEAVRQLDELVKAATDTSDVDPLNRISGGGSPSEPVGIGYSGGLPEEESPTGHSGAEEDQAWPDQPASHEDVIDVPDENVGPAMEASADDDEQTSDDDAISLLDRLRQTVTNELDASSADSDSVEAAATNQEASESTSDTVSLATGDTVSDPQSLLSSIFQSDAEDTAEATTSDSDDAESSRSAVSAYGTEDLKNSDTDTPKEMDGVRAQLADMFDLPELVPQKQADEASLDERFSSFYSGGETESSNEDESERPAETPVTADASPEVSESAPTAGEDGDDSIRAYMEDLLARNRRGGDTPELEIETPEPETPVVPEPVAVDDNDKDRSWLNEGPRHKQDRRQVEADTQKFRELANQSARSAVVVANRKQLRTAVIVKAIASCGALLIGAVALLVNLPRVFGFGIMGIGAVFAIDLAMTIGRNWTAVARLAKATRASDVSNSDDDQVPSGEATEIDKDSLRRRHDDPRPDVDSVVPVDRLARTLQAEIRKPEGGSGTQSLQFESLFEDAFGDSTSDDATSDETDSAETDGETDGE